MTAQRGFVHRNRHEHEVRCDQFDGVLETNAKAAQEKRRGQVWSSSSLPSRCTCLNMRRYLISMNRTHTALGTFTLAFVGDNSPVD